MDDERKRKRSPDDTDKLILESKRRLEELEHLLQRARELAAQQAEALAAIKGEKEKKKP